jgi:enoyl-CoA hydratase
MNEDTRNAVEVDDRDGILVVALNRPRTRNAVTREMGEMIAAAMDRLDHESDLKAAVLTSTNSSFCSGMDLAAYQRGELPEVPGRGFAGLTSSPPKKPLIAAVEGYALAGGFEMVLSCDLVIASETAKFGLPEVKRGLIAGSGGLLRLGTRMPPQIAMEYALTGKFINAAEAHRWGLINHLTAPGRALERAFDMAREISENGPLAVVESKRILTENLDWPADQRLARQAEALGRIFASRDAAEGAAAFTEKRLPQWTGE